MLSRRAASNTHFSKSRDVIGFPRPVLITFILGCIILGLLLAWAFYWSVQINSDQSRLFNPANESVRIDTTGLPVVNEQNLWAETQLLLNTGTLQTPATFDVAACASEIEVPGTLLLLEEVLWSNESRAWLLIHSNSSLNYLRNHGGEVFASVVRSSCGTATSQGAEHSIFWVGTVKTSAADASS